MDRAKILDEQNEVIYLVIMFTPSFMVIKKSKIDHILYFQLMTAKNSLQFGRNI